MSKPPEALGEPLGPGQPTRRTQAERRAGTVRKLLEATTEALIEVGYAKTSVQEICTRAGLTQGALFRHFSSRIELLIRTADDIGNGLLALYQADFERLRGQRDTDLELALELLRGNVQSRLHQAWFELLLAARTDTQLHDALAPIWKRREAQTQALAVQILPEAARALPDFAVIVDTIVTLFHGEAMDRFLRDDPRAEDRRMYWLRQQLSRLIGQSGLSTAD